MPIALETLRAESRTYVAKTDTLVEAKAHNVRTAFLCHSHKDQELALGLVNFLARRGVKLYVDWTDTAMPENPNRVTAIAIQKKIGELDLFLFLATPNSVASRWCPWEIGYADNAKVISKIFVIPTKDDSGHWFGNEYLQLYRKIDISDANQLQAYEAASSVAQPVGNLIY